jgi:hypothetical protein
MYREDFRLAAVMEQHSLRRFRRAGVHPTPSASLFRRRCERRGLRSERRRSELALGRARRRHYPCPADAGWGAARGRSPTRSGRSDTATRFSRAARPAPRLNNLHEGNFAKDFFVRIVSVG